MCRRSLEGKASTASLICYSPPCPPPTPAPFNSTRSISSSVRNAGLFNTGKYSKFGCIRGAARPLAGARRPPSSLPRTRGGCTASSAPDDAQSCAAGWANLQATVLHAAPNLQSLMLPLLPSPAAAVAVVAAAAAAPTEPALTSPPLLPPPPPPVAAAGCS
jgi:hypothetical protein